MQVTWNAHSIKKTTSRALQFFASMKELKNHHQKCSKFFRLILFHELILYQTFFSLKMDFFYFLLLLSLAISFYMHYVTSKYRKIKWRNQRLGELTQKLKFTLNLFIFFFSTTVVSFGRPSNHKKALQKRFIS